MAAVTPAPFRPPDLAVRRLEPELMDAPGLDRVRHERALDALARVNRLSRSAGRLLEEVERLCRDGGRPVRVLDVACGGGDVVRAVARDARARGLDVTVHGCDVAPTAVAFASDRARGVADVRFFELDAVRDPIPDEYDLVTSSLFLHHLSREDAEGLLRSMAAAARRAVFVQDLRRTRLGYLLASAVLRVLTRSEIARADGLTSVAGAFTLEEARALCAAAGLDGAEVFRCWPQRFAIRWRRP